MPLPLYDGAGMGLRPRVELKDGEVIGWRQRRE